MASDQHIFGGPYIYIKRASNSIIVNNEELLERITINPKIMVGKPVIRGTRLTVEYILGLLAHGISMEAILEEYPRPGKGRHICLSPLCL